MVFLLKPITVNAKTKGGRKKGKRIRLPSAIAAVCTLRGETA